MSETEWQMLGGARGCAGLLILPCEVSSGAAAEREGNTFKNGEDFCLENDSRKGQNLAFTVLFVPNSLDNGSVKLAAQKCTAVPRRARISGA